MSEALHEQIAAELAVARSVTIVSHIRPDGDAIGSMLGLAQALREAGKKVECVLQDGVAEKYHYLSGAKSVVREVESPFDYLIVLDCSDRERTGTVLADQRNPDLVIDHHLTHINFGRIDYVVPESEATALILTQSLPKWGFSISKEAGESLLTGIIADTIGFRTSNVSPEALRAAADLMDKGVNLSKIYYQTLLTRSVHEMRYWGAGLSEIHNDDGILWTQLTLQDRINSGYLENDDADLVNILSSVSDILIAIIFVEQEMGRVKVSWRSTGNIDVSVIATQMGGGGHKAAAGADITGDLSDVRQKVLLATRAYLNNDENTIREK